MLVPPPDLAGDGNFQRTIMIIVLAPVKPITIHIAIVPAVVPKSGINDSLLLSSLPSGSPSGAFAYGVMVLVVAGILLLNQRLQLRQQFAVAAKASSP